MIFTLREHDFICSLIRRFMRSVTSLREHIAGSRSAVQTRLAAHGNNQSTPQQAATIAFEMLKIAGACQRKFFLSIQSFAFRH
jgi:hypothetical protein